MRVEEYETVDAMYDAVAEAEGRGEVAHIAVKLTDTGERVDKIERLVVHAKRLSDDVQCKYCMTEEAALDMHIYNRPVHVMTPGFTVIASDRQILDLVTDLAAEVEAKLAVTFMRMGAGVNQAIEEELHDMIGFVAEKSREMGIPMSHMIHPVLFAVWPILMSTKVQGQFMPESELQ